MWLEQFKHNTSQKGAKDTFGPHWFGNCDQGDDQEKGQPDVELRGGFIDSFEKAKEPPKPFEQNDGC